MHPLHDLQTTAEREAKKENLRIASAVARTFAAGLECVRLTRQRAANTRVGGVATALPPGAGRRISAARSARQPGSAAMRGASASFAARFMSTHSTSASVSSVGPCSPCDWPCLCGCPGACGCFVCCGCACAAVAPALAACRTSASSAVRPLRSTTPCWLAAFQDVSCARS
eukprot:190239-Chlamydomonas_euryale.AAC.3